MTDTTVTPPAPTPAPAAAPAQPTPAPAAVAPTSTPAPVGSLLNDAVAPAIPAAPVVPPSGQAALYANPAPAPAPVDPAAPPAADPAAAAPAAPDPNAPPVDPAAPAPVYTPDSYNLTLPEAFTSDAALMSNFKAVATEAQVPPEVAQKFADIGVSMLEAQQNAAKQWVADTAAKWEREYKALPEFQGEQAAISTATLGRFRDEFLSPETQAILKESGLGNNPHIIKDFLAVSRILVEGEPTPTGRPAGGKPARGPAALYPSSTN